MDYFSIQSITFVVGKRIKRIKTTCRSKGYTLFAILELNISSFCSKPVTGNMISLELHQRSDSRHNPVASCCKLMVLVPSPHCRRKQNDVHAGKLPRMTLRIIVSSLISFTPMERAPTMAITVLLQRETVVQILPVHASPFTLHTTKPLTSFITDVIAPFGCMGLDKLNKGTRVDISSKGKLWLISTANTLDRHQHK